MKLHCQVTLLSNSEHTLQVVSGFLLLHRQGVIGLDIQFRPERAASCPSTHMVEATLNGEITLAYDLLDGYNYVLPRAEVESYLSGVHLYFKRSFDSALSSTFAGGSRMMPLGLNYHCTTSSPVFCALDLAQAWHNRDARGVLRAAGKVATGYYRAYTVPRFEDAPRRTGEGPILFTTRTWSPAGEEDALSEELREERERINEMRATCIRLLRREFGERFVGGFTPSDYAREHYPDCIADGRTTERRHFMALVKRADVCVATMGLHRSNGWKLGEYVAASKAIVSERLCYAVPGDFSAGANYLEFAKADECLAQTVALVGDRERLDQMRLRNFAYYHEYLRPDRLVWHSLMCALGQQVPRHVGESAAPRSLVTVS